jgi:hypothetical protein
MATIESKVEMAGNFDLFDARLEADEARQQASFETSRVLLNMGTNDFWFSEIPGIKECVLNQDVLGYINLAEKSGIKLLSVGYCLRPSELILLMESKKNHRGMTSFYLTAGQFNALEKPKTIREYSAFFTFST